MVTKISIIDPADVDPILLRAGNIVSRRLVTRKKDGSERMSFHINVLKGGNRSIGVVYPDQDEINYMVRGEATISFDGERHRLRDGMVWNIPAGRSYDIENEEEIVLISVFSPPRE
jgi:mannose-6-phosphate isomerase-like protein (cupin superfamily)